MKSTASTPPKADHFAFVHSFGGPAAKFLKQFLAVRLEPSRYKVGMDHEMLNWAARVWNEAAIAAAGNTRLREACLAEAKRYGGLEKKLYHDEKNGPPGQGIVPAVIMLDSENDWPHVNVIKGAIKVLERAEIKFV